MAFRSIRFDGRSRARASLPAENGAWRGIVAAASILVMLVGLAGWYAFGARSDYLNDRDQTTLCLVHGPTPRAELTLLDQTDPLAADSGQRFTRLIRHIRDELPRNGRLTIVPFNGNPGQSLEVAFDICSPGRGSQADQWTEGALRVQRDYVARFEEPLDRTAAALTVRQESRQSPIVMQILRAINDPSISWRGEERVLNLLTDGLENTTESRVYSDGLVRLPPPPPDLLRGVTVNYYELVSAHHSVLQTAAVRAAWKAWFEAAGARVNMYAPGYAAPNW